MEVIWAKQKSAKLARPDEFCISKEGYVVLNFTINLGLVWN